MKCFHPISIDLAGTDASDYYRTILGTDLIKVPCGKCIACLRQKRNEWVFRLNSHMKDAQSAYFISLTYDDSHLPYSTLNVPTLVKEHLHEFLHNLVNEGQRLWQEHLKQQGLKWQERKKMRLSIRYFAVGEYGDDYDRPHYHVVLFDFPADRLGMVKAIEKLWKYEEIMPDVHYASARLLNYITKYMLKEYDEDEQKFRQPPFRCMSKGLGKNYVSRSRARQHILADNFLSNVGNAKYVLPRYIKTKLAETYYSEKHCIGKSDKDFWYSLGANAYKKAKDFAEVVGKRKKAAGFNHSVMVEQEKLLHRQERIIREMKKLNYRRR
jgi:hypothetical protein